jgi:hypothetical protein
VSINDWRLYGRDKKAQGSIDVSAPKAPVEEPVSDDTVPIPTVTSRKAEIFQFLTDTQGIDPEDLDGLTKSELLELLE